MPPRTSQPAIIIAGVGLVTPLAHSAWENFTALLAGRMLTDRAAKLPAEPPGIPAIVPVDLVRALGCVSVAQHVATDPAVALAEMAGREAIMMAGGAAPREAILGASKGAVHALCELADSVHLARSNPKAAASVTRQAGTIALGPHGLMTAQLAQRLGLRQARSTVAACASSLTAVHQARLRLLHDPPPEQRMLVLTSEAALLPLFIHSYARLGVLPPLTADGYRGLPLDRDRSGFLLAELAAAAVLERVERAMPGQVELVDTAIAAESFDVIRPAPGMPALARVAGELFAGRKIDLLHPHATGTPDNDAAELETYARALEGRDELPDVYANKGALGHGLGAAGLVSLVVAWLCTRAGRRPAMPWLKTPMESAFRLAAEAPRGPASLPTHAVFAAGFGGHVAGAVLRRV